MNLNFSNSSIGRLRITGLAEGTSFLLLLLIAMPLKYIGHIPQPVKIIGWIHGVLFVLYSIALINVWITFKWSFKRALIAFLASLMPLGTFLIDAQLRKDEEALKINNPQLP